MEMRVDTQALLCRASHMDAAQCTTLMAAPTLATGRMGVGQDKAGLPLSMVISTLDNTSVTSDTDTEGTSGRHRVLSSRPVAQGTLDSATIYPREVIGTCLRHHCAAVIFAHNHPSGSLEPSLADRKITKKLKNALNSVDIRLLDHFIVSSQGCASMAELGMV